MSAPALSATAAGLLRSLITRSEAKRSDVLLTEVRSVDWRSLTFDGERHEIAMRFTGPEAAREAERMLEGLDEHEFVLAGTIVADITVVGRCVGLDDASVSVALEALTICSD